MGNSSDALFEDNTTAYIFRVRLKRREVEETPIVWRGSIEHVASGRVKYMTDMDEIARFIGSSWKRWASIHGH